MVQWAYTILLDKAVTQWRSQNAKKVSHIKVGGGGGGLLNQAMILFDRIPF